MLKSAEDEMIDVLLFSESEYCSSLHSQAELAQTSALKKLGLLASQLYSYGLEGRVAWRRFSRNGEFPGPYVTTSRKPRLATDRPER
jgi:hypothetical protein